MKDKIRNFLSLSSSERKGVIVLIFLVLIITGIQAYLSFHPVSPAPLVDTSLIREVAYFEEQLKQEKTNNYGATTSEEDLSEQLEITPDSAGLFYFDPNTASSVDLKRLGMSKKVIGTLLNYRLHGGKFYAREDLMKVYGLSKFTYNRLSPYIIIRNIKKAEKPGTVLPVIKEDINKADSLSLLAIKGIGPVLSRRIIRYRKALGGYSDMEQLKEVYGMPDSVMVVLNGQYFADTTGITRINVNTASLKELSGHPYIGKYVAGGIVKYRSRVKLIKSPDELKINGLITGAKFEKVKKYIVI
jgi:competence protein ComEA